MTPRELLIRWRKAASLTQQQAATELCYRTPQTISDKERGVIEVNERDVKLIRSHASEQGIDLSQEHSCSTA